MYKPYGHNTNVNMTFDSFINLRDKFSWPYYQLSLDSIDFQWGSQNNIQGVLTGMSCAYFCRCSVLLNTFKVNFNRQCTLSKGNCVLSKGNCRTLFVPLLYPTDRYIYKYIYLTSYILCCSLIILVCRKLRSQIKYFHVECVCHQLIIITSHWQTTHPGARLTKT